MKIAISGSGITALTAAYKLRQQGHEIHVFEMAPSSGGLASSVNLNGCFYDFGPHEFITNNSTLVDILKDVLGDKFMRIEKVAAQYLYGRYINYPSKPLQLACALPFSLTCRIAVEVIANKLKMLVMNPSDYSFKSWVVNRFGNTLYEVYFGPYTRKVWGINPDLLDARTASDRIAFDSLFDFVWQSFSHYFLNFQNFKNTHNPMRDDFYYAKGGIGVLTSGLYQKCIDMGVLFNFSRELIGIRHKNGAIKSIEFSDGSKFENFDFLISTIPLNHLCALLAERVPELTFRSMVFVFLKFKGLVDVPYQWIYTPSKDHVFQRITNFQKFDADLCPENSTGLGLEIACDYEDDLWNMQDEEIISKVMSDLGTMNLFEASNKPEFKIVRQRFAYPLQKTGYIDKIQKSLALLSQYNNLLTVGRQGQFKYCNMNECMEMALDAADCVDSGRAYSYDINSKWRGAGMDVERTLEDKFET